MSGESDKEHLEVLLHPFDKVPMIQVSGDELQAIRAALRGYSGYLLSGGQLSLEQRQLVLKMSVAQDKLNHNMQQAQRGQHITDGLEFEDIEVMSEALVGFIHAISQRVPKSPERNEVLARLRFLWQRIEKLLDDMATGTQ